MYRRPRIRRLMYMLQSPNVDDESLVSALANLLGDKAVLFAFGIHCAQDCDRCHSEWRFRSTPRRRCMQKTGLKSKYHPILAET